MMRSRAPASHRRWHLAPPRPPSPGPAASACGRPPGAVARHARPRGLRSRDHAPDRRIRPRIPDAGARPAPAPRACARDLACRLASRRYVGSPSSPRNASKSLASRKVAIHRGKAHIRHRIHLAQRLHHQFADLLAGDVALARGLQLAHDAVHHPLHPLLRHRPLAQRDADRAGQLVAVERHPPARRTSPP